jgi:hypothetical protein
MRMKVFGKVREREREKRREGRAEKEALSSANHPNYG